MTTLADNIVALQATVASIQTELASISTAIAAIPTTSIPAAPVDLSPILTAIAAEDAEHIAMETQIDKILTAVTITPSTV